MSTDPTPEQPYVSDGEKPERAASSVAPDSHDAATQKPAAQQDAIKEVAREEATSKEADRKDGGGHHQAGAPAERARETPSSFIPTKMRLAVVGTLTAVVFGFIWYVTRPSDPHIGAAPGAPRSEIAGGEVVVVERHVNGQPRVVVTYPEGSSGSALDSTDLISRRFYTSGGVLYRREDLQSGHIERYGDLYPQTQDGAIWRYLGGLWRRTPHASQPAPLPGGGKGRVQLVEERLFRGDTMIVRQVVTLRDGERVVRSDDYRTGFQMERRGQGIIAPTQRLFEYKNGERRTYAPGDSMRLIPDDLRRAVADTLRLQHPNRFEVLTSEVPGGRKAYERVN